MTDVFEKSKWIWLNDCVKENVYINFYEKLYIDTKAGAYHLCLSIDSQYALYINDRFVDSGQYTDYPGYKIYDVLDITAFLHEGENHVRIEGYWYGVDGSMYRKEAPGAIYTVIRDTGSDKEMLLYSGENTMTCLNNAYENEGVEKVSPQLLFSFKYDVRKADITVLKKAQIQDKDVQLYPRPIKKLDILDRQDAEIIAWGTFKENQPNKTMGERMQYASLGFRYLGAAKRLPDTNGISHTYGEIPQGDVVPDGLYTVIDLGAESVGYINLDIDLPRDCEILIGWGEHLEDLRVRTHIGIRHFVASYKGKAGRNTFVHPFKRMGLRYLQLHVYAPSMKLYYAGILPTVYPLSDKPYFKCSDHLHNKIYEVSVATLQHCMHDHYEDTPWREQALYTMDSRNQMLCGYYAFGEFSFAKASLRLIGLSLRSDHMLELCSPARVKITIPCFSAIYLMQLNEYLIHSGDTEFVKEMLPIAKKIADKFIRLCDEIGLLTAFSEKQYWNFYEWQEGLSGGHGVSDLSRMTYDAPLNAFVSMAFASLSKIYGILGNKIACDYYLYNQNKLNRAMHTAFFDGEREVYASYKNVHTGELSNYAELTQALMVCCGTCPGEKRDRVLAALVDDSLLPVTLSHSIFKYEALMQEPERYGRFVFNHVAQLWGHMLYNQATTFWETIEGASAFFNAGSLCHAWSAIPVALYYKYGAGFKISEDGSATYKVAPVESGLYECEALIETPHGDVKI